MRIITVRQLSRRDGTAEAHRPQTVLPVVGLPSAGYYEGNGREMTRWQNIVRKPQSRLGFCGTKPTNYLRGRHFVKRRINH